MRAMILGAAGMLGHDLVANAPKGTTLLPYTRATLDITDSTALTAAVADARPDVIFNAAAYTAVDRAESDPDMCFRVNAEPMGGLGRISAQMNARVVHFSTDYLFDGIGPIEANACGIAEGDRFGVTDGYWVMLKPLSAGEHAVHFTASLEVDGSVVFAVDVTYDITQE